MIKEERIITAAKKVFFTHGFQKSKMEMIAKEVGCSKVTLYNHFESKEDLYMALTHEALKAMINLYYKTLSKNKSKNGLKSLLAFTEVGINFRAQNPNEAELIMNYRKLIKQVINGKGVDSITEAMSHSDYYRRIKDMQNLPITIVVDEIKRGQADGSITDTINPWLIHHLMWSTVSGFLALPSQNSSEQFINVDISEWRKYVLKVVKGIATGAI